MLTGDENIVDVDFSVFWKVKPNGVGQYLFNIQNPEGTVKAVAESAMREVVGQLRHRAAPVDCAADHRSRRARPDAEDARRLRRRHPDPTGAVAEGRSAAAGDRRLPRRAGRAHRPGPLGQRGADLRQPRDPASARQCRQDRAGGGSLSPADGGGGDRSDVALHPDLRPVQEGARGDPRAHVSGDHGARARRRQQGHHRFQGRRPGRGALSAAQRALQAGAASEPPHPAASVPGQPHASGDKQ